MNDKIGRQMQELHDELGEAEIIDIGPVIAAKTAATLPPDDENWLNKLAVGTTILTTKRVLLGEPELIKVTIMNKTKLSSYLMLDIPGGSGSMFVWYNTLMYSKRYVHMDTL